MEIVSEASLNPVLDIETEGLDIVTLVFYVMIMTYTMTENRLEDMIEDYKDRLKEIEALQQRGIAFDGYLEGEYANSANLDDILLTQDMNGDGAEELVLDMGDDIYVVLNLKSNGTVSDAYIYDAQTMGYSGVGVLDQLAEDITMHAHDDSLTTNGFDFYDGLGAHDFTDAAQAGDTIVFETIAGPIKIDFNEGNDTGTVSSLLITSGAHNIQVDMSALDGPAGVSTEGGQQLDEDHIDSNTYLFDLSGHFEAHPDGAGSQEVDEAGGLDYMPTYAEKALFNDPGYLVWKEASADTYSGLSDEEQFAYYMEESFGYTLPSNYLDDLSWITDLTEKDGVFDTKINTLMSTDQIDMLNIQRIVNQLNFIVTLLTNFLQSTHQAQLAVARNLS